MADRIDLFDPTVLDELITRIISPDSPAHISGVISNANGHYFRVGDWQVCFRRASQTFSNQAARSSSFVWAAPFIDAAYVPLLTTDSAGDFIVGAFNRQASFTGWGARTAGGGNYSGEVAVFAVAIGRWR